MRPLAIALAAVAAFRFAGTLQAQEAVPCSRLPGATAPPNPIRPTAQSETLEKGRETVGMTQEEWDIEHCVPTPSARVDALRSLFASASDSVSAGPLVAALRREWTGIRDNKAIHHPEVGPQAVTDIIHVDRMIQSLAAEVQDSVRAIPVDASLDLAAGIYQRWADSVTRVKRKEGDKVAKTGIPPYAIARSMIRIDRTRALLGGEDRGVLDEVRGLLETAWSHGARNVPCNATRADFDRVTHLARNMKLLGSKTETEYSTEEALVRWTRAEAKDSDQPARAKLAEVAMLFGLKGLASEINSGKIQPNNPRLTITPTAKVIEPRETVDLELTFLTCGKQPATDRAVSMKVAPEDRGTFSVRELRTDAEGKARVKFTAGSKGGPARIRAEYIETDLHTGERTPRHAASDIRIAQWKGTITIALVSRRDSAGPDDDAMNRYVERDSVLIAVRVDGEEGTASVAGRILDDLYHRGAPVPCEGGEWVDRRHRKKRGSYTGGGPVQVSYQNPSGDMWIVRLKEPGYTMQYTIEFKTPPGQCHEYQTRTESESITVDGTEPLFMGTMKTEGTGADARRYMKGEQVIRVTARQTLTLAWDLEKR